MKTSRGAGGVAGWVTLAVCHAVWTAEKPGPPARLGYYDNYLVDNASCVIVGVQATAARMSQETVAAQDMLTFWTGVRTGYT